MYLVCPLEAIGKEDVDVLPSLFEKALIESREGNFVDALQSWDEFILLSPKDGVALSNRGNIRLALGDPEGAIIDQTNAIDLLPHEIDPHLNRGIAEEALQKWNEAKDDYQWILDRDPENSSAIYNLANVEGSEGNWFQAKFLFEKASLVKLSKNIFSS